MKLFRKLLSESDAFVTNLRPAALKRLGITYDDLKEDFPGLIYAILLGYGEKGPEAAKPAFDTSAFWAKSGFLLDLAVKNDNYTPVYPPYSMGDTLCGYMLMGQICAALYRKKETGLGDYIRSGLYNNAIFSMGTMVINTQPEFGRPYPRVRADYGATSGDYKCSDGEYVFISGYVDKLAAFHKMLGREDLTEDPRFSTAGARWENRQEYYEAIRQAFAEHSSAHWLEKSIEFDLPLIKMKHFHEVATDEQAWANGYLEQVTFKNGRTDIMPRSPISMNSVGELKTVPAPEIGADTEEIMKELGYTAEETAKLNESGIVKVGKR